MYQSKSFILSCSIKFLVNDKQRKHELIVKAVVLLLSRRLIEKHFVICLIVQRFLHLNLWNLSERIYMWQDNAENEHKISIILF